jgi:hypothetical protein
MINMHQKQAKSQAQVFVQFPEDFESTSVVSLGVEGSLPKGFENWIWDLYYAKTLYNLSKNAISYGLKEQLESWAEQWASSLLSGLPLPPEALVLDSEINIVGYKLGSENEEYRIDIIETQNEWPLIQTYLPNDGFLNRTAYSVLALAQFLINQDNTYFARELSIHILAMKRFYAVEGPYTSIGSVVDAPVYAVNSAMKVFEELDKE